MKTSDFVACSGIYKSLAGALHNGSRVILIVGAPGCGKSSFCRAFLKERGYCVADIVDILEKESVTRFVRSFCDTGGVFAMMNSIKKQEKKVVFLDDNLAMGMAAYEALDKSSAVLIATTTAKMLSKYPMFRKRCTMLKMNNPPKKQCLAYLSGVYPDHSSEDLSKVIDNVSGSILRARMAIDQGRVSDYIEDMRKMDMSVYDIVASTLKMSTSYEDVAFLTSSEPVMMSIMMQEMNTNPRCLKSCNDVLATGNHDLAEIACYAGYLYSRNLRGRKKVTFPRCYCLASTKGASVRRAETFCEGLGLRVWPGAFIYTKKK